MAGKSYSGRELKGWLIPAVAVALSLGTVRGQTVYTFAGITGSQPAALAFDSSGNLYVTSQAPAYPNQTVYKITPGGSVSTLASSGLYYPYGVAVDSSGNVYVGNNGTGYISKFNSAGTLLSSNFTGAASAANTTRVLAFDTYGNLYASNQTTGNIVKIIINAGAYVSTNSSFATGFTFPNGLAFDSSGNLYVANATGGAISKITINNGSYVSTNNSYSSVPGCNYMAFDTSGNLYVSTTGNAISRIPPGGGTATTYLAAGAGLSGPQGLAFDSTGNLYIAQLGGAKVSIVYTGSPQVTAVSPATGVPAGGTAVTITGTGFPGATAVNFGAIPAATYTVNGGGTISATSPAGLAGTVDITVTTAAGTSPTGAADQFTYAIPAAPASSTPAPTVTVPVPVITSPLAYSSPVNQTFSYTIFASNTPTSYNATNVPPGCYINTYTGGITGTPTIAGVYAETIGASNAGGTGTAALVVTITPASQTITFPVPASVMANAASFTLAATSSSGLPITYTVLSGPATVSGNTVTLTGTVGTVTIQASQGGNLAYSAAGNAVVSFPVTAAPKPVLVNLSARSAVTPAVPMMAGFVIAGTAAKTVVLRGVGPSLSSFGLSPVLAHPQLSVLDVNGNVLATNTGWGGSAALASAFGSVGAFPLAATSADSAVMATLSPGAYTMKLADAVNDSGGMALGELYDASVDPTGVTQKLINLSSRGQVGTGNGVLVCGFMVSGTSAKPLLIRGVGPSLAPYGLTGLLADPVLNVYDGFGNLVATNNDWGTPVGVTTTQVTATAATLTSTAAQVGAFPLIVGSKDAALIVTLAPGAYTIQVSGNGGTTGNGMTEVYEIPQ